MLASGPFVATAQLIADDIPVLSWPNPAVPKSESFARLHFKRMQIAGASTTNSAELLKAPETLLDVEKCFPVVKSCIEILNVPLGTVQSRISRGIAQLQQLLLARSGEGIRKQPPKEAHG